MEENPTRICELLVGLGEVEVLGVDDEPGGALGLHVRTRARPSCGGCGGAPVYELEPEAFEGGPVPDGVHLTQNDDGSVTVIFEHPETGEELVTVITRRTSSTGLTFENPFEDLPDLSFEGLPDLSIEDLHEHLDKWLEDLDNQLEDFNDRFEDLIPYVDWSAPGPDLADLLERLRERLDGARHDGPAEPNTLDVRVSRA